MCILRWGLPSLITAKLFPCSNPHLGSTIFLLFSSLLSHRLPYVPHHLSLIVLSLFRLYISSLGSKQLCRCQVVCDNFRLMGIKRKRETQENTAILLTSPVFSWYSVKEQEVTREKKKGSCTDYWKKGASFSRVRMGYQTSTWWQHCDLQSFSPSVSSHSLAPMFSHLREGIHWLGAGMKLLQHQSFVRISQDYKLILYAVLCCKQHPLPLHLNNHFCHYFLAKENLYPFSVNGMMGTVYP